MRKKALITILLCTLLFCLLAACGEIMAPGADTDWYMNVLDDDAIKADFSNYAFKDINGNGVPLLFVSTTEEAFIGDEDTCRVYAYANGDPKLMKEIGGAAGEKFFVNEKEHTVTYYYRMSGESHIEVFTSKDGEWDMLLNADYYAQNHGPEEHDGNLYKENGNEITEERYNELMDLYANDADVVTYPETIK